jgi:SHS2 domain-containing protein
LYRFPQSGAVLAEHLSVINSLSEQWSKQMPQKAGYEELEHTADWALRVWAPDPAGLFEQAAHGMLELCGVSIDARKAEMRRLEIEAIDRESLLVSFLGELLHILSDEKIAFDHFNLQMDGNKLLAKLEGGYVVEQRKEIKAVTYHNLSIRETERGLETEIVFDV